MNYLDAIITRALIGTARDAGALPAAPELLAGVLTDTSASGESAVLRGAAAFCLIERAGRLPVKMQNALSAPADDARPICSKKAGTLLRQILDSSRPMLLVEWLDACCGAGQRPPPALIARLLDAATRQIEHRTALRAPTVKAAGPLGFWLCRLNPDWSTLANEDLSVNVEEVWQTGAKAARTAALHRLRAADPAAGLMLLQTTFASDSAADRAAFMGILATGLGAADEVFLESALADRSKEVRAAAAKLLAQLPGSALVRRMIARVEPLVQFTPGEPKKLLRAGKPAKLTFELPAACDEPMKSDGIEARPTPGAGYGERQFWLLQMLSLIGPSYWSKKFGTAPGHLLEAVPKEDAEVIHLAWRQAAETTGDADWVEAFIRLRSSDDRGYLTENLLKLLPTQRRHDVVYDLLADRTLSSAAVLTLMSAGPLDARSARVVMKWVTDRPRGPATADYTLTPLLAALAMGAPPALLQEFEVAWPVEGFPAARGEHEKFFATMSLRQNIQKEFPR